MTVQYSYQNEGIEELEEDSMTLGQYRPYSRGRDLDQVTTSSRTDLNSNFFMAGDQKELLSEDHTFFVIHLPADKRFEFATDLTALDQGRYRT